MMTCFKKVAHLVSALCREGLAYYNRRRGLDTSWPSSPSYLKGLELLNLPGVAIAADVFPRLEEYFSTYSYIDDILETLMVAWAC